MSVWKQCRVKMEPHAGIWMGRMSAHAQQDGMDLIVQTVSQY